MSSAGFIERSLERFSNALVHAFESEQLAHADGLLQRFNPRVKLIGLPLLVIAAVASRRLTVIAAIFVIAVLLGALSRVPIRRLAFRVWLAVLAFTGTIAFPAVFITPGQVIARLPLLGWNVTDAGLRSAAYLTARAETAATLSVLLVLCTPWARLLKAMRTLRVPVVIVVILSMTYRYLFVLLETAQEMFQSRRSRQVGALEPRQRRALAGASAGVLMGRTFQLSNDVYLAMQSRGYAGEVYLLSESRLRMLDFAALLGFLAVFACALWAGR